MKWKHWLRYPIDIRVAHRALADRRKHAVSASTGEAIGLDLTTDDLLIDCGRHLACIAAHAQRGNLSVFLRCDSVLLAAISHKPLGRLFLGMPNVFHLRSKSAFPAGATVLTDADRPSLRGPVAGQHVVRMLIGRDLIPDTPVMPYPMFPGQIAALDDDALCRFRQRPKAGIFFAGNQKSRYGRDSMRREFGLLSRLEVIETLVDAFPQRVVPLDAAGKSDRIVLRATHRDPIASADWVDTLSRHQFFLCCPGVSQPVCHNVIEAMSVGAIPILEYSDRFAPALIDGVNAICFQGRRGLIGAIERIDAMGDLQRDRIHRAVCEHYDRHLCGSRFLKRLHDEARLGLVDAVSMPFHNRNLFDRDLADGVQVRRSEKRAA